MNKKNTPVINIGSASMLVIFIVLCLVTFATLSLASASSDYNFSKKISSRTTDYYEASNQASEILQQIDNILSDAYTNSRGSYFTSASNTLASLSINGITTDFTLSKPTIAYSVKINDSQALNVTLILTSPIAKGAPYYHISTWQVVSTATWHGNNKLNLLGGK